MCNVGKDTLISDLVRFLEWLNEEGDPIMAGLDYLPDYEDRAREWVDLVYGGSHVAKRD